MIKRFIPAFTNCLINKEASIRDALKAISDGGALMACIVEDSGKLVGIVTDSDIRKGLLKGFTLESPATQCTRFRPITGDIKATSDELIALSNLEGVREIPLVDSLGRVQDIFVLLTHQERVSVDESLGKQKPWLDHSMLIFAGGKGTRLRSVVSDRPKPLALVGGKPILQTLIQRAKGCGIKNFVVSVNYLAEQVQEHLAADIYKDLSIACIKEQMFLGTAGCLGLVQEYWTKPLLVANGDLITNIPFDAVIEHHESSGSDLTCVVRPYTISVPYGVFEINHDKIVSVHEKPVYNYLVNAGIYVISPTLSHLIKTNEVLDMPELIERAISGKFKVSPFLMHEYWLDVGKPEDFAKANDEFVHIFGS